jgi:cell division protein FtsW
LFPVLLLVGTGVVMVYSASSAVALKKFGTDYHFLKKQAVFAILGLVVLVGCRHVPYPFFRQLSYPLLLTAFGLLVIIQVTGFGFTAGGSTRWIRFGGFTFQPSEFVRFALVVYLAYSMEKKRKQIHDFYIGFIPHVMVLGVFTALIFMQPDFGTVVLLGILTWTMMFIGGVRIVYLVSSLVFLVPVVYIFMISAEYRIKRIVSFFNPWQYPSDEGYQVVHSLMAFGTGGVWGEGIGKGFQKLFYLPEPHTDFIFSVIGEELGLVGILIILGLYAMILFRGVSIARHAPDLFGSYMAVGLTVAIILQVCVNMSVTLGLVPTKGLSLPFLSYGGSSLLLNMAFIGVLMNIGGAKRRKP